MIKVNGFWLDSVAILAVYDSFDKTEINRLKATAHTLASMLGGKPADYIDMVDDTVYLDYVNAGGENNRMFNTSK